MRIRLIVNVGIIALIVTGCATPHAAPRALAPLSCGAGQRIVIVASPVDCPDVAGIFKRSGSIYWLPFGGNILSLGLVNTMKVEDLTTEFKEAIGVMLGSINFQQLLLARAEQVIKPLSSSDTAFLPTTLENPPSFNSSDRVVVISLYFMFTSSPPFVGPPAIKGYLSAMVMTGENAAELEKRADEMGKIMKEMKEMEPYVKVGPSVSLALTSPDLLGKLKQYRALGQKLGDGLRPYIDGAGTVNYTSPGHSTDEWLADGGAVTKKEITAMMDRLICDVAGILFKQ